MKLIITFLILIFISCSTRAQQLNWVRVYDNIGGIYNDSRTFIEMNDSGYFLTGYFCQNQTQSGYSFAFRLNKTGDTIWTRKYAQAYTNTIVSMVSATDSTLMCLGGFQYNSSQSLFNVAEINFNGDTLRTHYYYDSTYYNTLGRIRKCKDEGYIICTGIITSPYIIKIDSNLNMQWTKTPNLEVDNIIQDIDSNYIAIGYSGLAVEKYGVLKMNQNGNTIWYRTMGNMPPSVDRYYGYDIVVMPDSNYLIATNGDDWQMMKVNKTTGDTMWTKQYCDYLNPTCEHIGMVRVADAGNNRFICAHEVSYDGLALIDGTNGDTIWTRPWGPLFNFLSVQIEKTLDGGFAYMGSTGGFPGYTVLVKLDSLGNTLWTSFINTEASKLIDFYPNPTSKELNISTSLFATENNLTITLSNMQGKIILHQQFDKTKAVDVSSLPNGIYVAEVRGKEKVVRGKVVVQH